MEGMKWLKCCFSHTEIGKVMYDIYTGFGYADDLKLLSPSVHTLRILANICEKYAAKYDITFNGKKSQLIIYKCKQACSPDPGIFINNVKVPCVSEVIHLGQCLNEDIYKFSANKCLQVFNRQCNIFFC